MTVDAVLTVLGDKRVQRWPCKDDAEFELACRSEEKLVKGLETNVSEQLGHSIQFDKRILGYAGISLNAIEPRSLPIGNSDGLAWLQDMFNEEIEKRSTNIDDVQSLDSAIALNAQNFRHLLEHHPVSGLFLPENFPQPFCLGVKSTFDSCYHYVKVKRRLDPIFDRTRTAKGDQYIVQKQKAG